MEKQQEKERDDAMISPQDQGESRSLDDVFLAFAHLFLQKMEAWRKRAGMIPLNLLAEVIFYENDFDSEERDQYPIAVGYLPPEQRNNDEEFLSASVEDPLWTSQEAYACVARWGEVIGTPFSPSPMPIFVHEGLPIAFQNWAFLRCELVVPILDVLVRDETLQPPDEHLLESFHRFQREQTDPFVCWDISIPLVGSRSNVQQIEPLGSFLLAPFPLEERERIWNTFEGRLPINIADFANTTLYLMSTRREQREAFNQRDRFQTWLERTRPDPNWKNVPPYRAMVDEVEDIITALRLIKAGDVRVPSFIERLHTQFPRTEEKVIYSLHDHSIYHESHRHLIAYVLNETDLVHVRTFFQALQQLRTGSNDLYKPHGPLSIALRRFNQAYHRELPEDQIIDLTIALESSLLAKERDELNYRLSLRGAALLVDAEPKWETNRSQALLKTMYDVRSGIVHDGQRIAEREKDLRKLQSVGISPQEFLVQCENIVRDILKAYVLRGVLGQSTEQVNRDLDKRILQGLMISVQ